MPSRLRHTLTPDSLPIEATQSIRPQFSRPPQKKQKMSLTQTYHVAASARSKLGREAARPDHDLRLLVGHANLLDALMLELAEAEREQERWFEQTVRRVAGDEPKHVRWVDAVVEEDIAVDDDEEMDERTEENASDSSDSDYDDDPLRITFPLRKLKAAPVHVTTTEVDDEEDSDEDMFDEEDDEEHALTRTHSHPPELVLDDDSEDDLPSPPSPPQPTFTFTEKQRQAIATTAYYDEKPSELQADRGPAMERDGYFLPDRQAAVTEVF